MDSQVADGSLFGYLDRDDRAYLLELGESRRFDRGDVLLREGDPTDHVFVLSSGWVRVYSASPDGQEVVLALRGPGDLIGELAVLHGWNRTVSIAALEPLVVVQLRAAQFVGSLRDRPGIAIAMIKQTSARLREHEQALLEFATQDVSRRVAGYLLRMARQHGLPGPRGVALSVPLSQQDIANRVGASLRAVARAMAMLRERGLVVTTRRGIVVARPEVLRSFVGPANVPNGR